MIQTINISLIPSDNKPVINVSQFDNVSRVLRFNVFDDAEMTVPHVFDNTETVLLNIRKNDNNIVVITGVIVSDIDPETQEVTDQYLTFELTEQACACVGSNFGEVSITRGSDEVIGSCNFKLIVERSPLAGGVSSQTAIDNLTTQIEQITEEVIGENYYTKTETDNLLDGKADVSDLPDMTNYYDKTEVDNLLDGKADVSDLPDMTDYYTKTETDNLLDGKADVSDLPDMSDYYTKTETDNKIAALIDDSQTVNNKTWSSNKISNELYALLPVGSDSGEIVSFNTALAKPLESIIVDENATRISKTTGNSAYAPYFRGLVNGSFYAVDLGSLEWAYIESYGVFRASLPYNSLTASCLTIPYEYSVYSYGASRPDKTINTGSAFYGPNRVTIKDESLEGNVTSLITSLDGVYCIYPLIDSLEGISLADYSIVCNSFDINGDIINLPLQSTPITYIGDNNFFADIGDISLMYKDTIQNYIDTRVNAVSNRSLSMMRTLETLEKSAELERGDNNENER